MSLETQKGRTTWLNAVLEAHIAGEAFSGLAATYIAEAAAAESPLSASTVPSLLSTLVSGDYLSVLTGAPQLSASLFARALACLDASAPDQWVSTLTSAVAAWIAEGDVELASSESDVTEREERDIFCLLAGIAALAAFTQVNTAGLPLIAPASSAPVPAAWPSLSALLSPARSRAMAAALRANGEDVYPSLYHPALLLLARVLLAALPAAMRTACKRDEDAGFYCATASALVAAPAARLWALRALAAHDSALLDSAASVARAATAVLRSVERDYTLGAFAGVRGGLAGAESDVDPTADVDVVDAGVAADGVIPASAAFASTAATAAAAAAATATEDEDEDGEETGVAGSVSRGMVPSASAAAALASSLASSTDSTGSGSWTRAPAVLRRSVCATACLEAAALARSFWKHDLSRRLLSAAATAAGCAAALTGVSGKRTRYQRTATAQLVLVGASESEMLALPAEADASAPAAAVASHLGASPADIAAASAAAAAAAAAGAAAAPAVGEFVPDAPLDTFDDTLLAIPAVAPADRGAGASLLPSHARADAVEGVFTALGLATALAHAEHVRSAQAVGEVATGEALAFVYAPLVQELRRAGYDDSLAAHVTDGVVPSASPAAGMAVLGRPKRGKACGHGHGHGHGHACGSAGEKEEQEQEQEQEGGVETCIVSRSELLTRPTWSTAAHSLYLRSLLEQGDYRRQTRSFAQLEALGTLYPPSLGSVAPGDAAFTGPAALSDGTRNAEADAPRAAARPLSLPAVRWRMEGIYASGMRPWWLSRRGYAEIATSAGLRQAALDVFVQIGLWEQVIETYVALGRNALAESLLRSRLPRAGWLEGATEANNAAAVAFVASSAAAVSTASADNGEDKEVGGDVPPAAYSAPIPAPVAVPAPSRVPATPADAEAALRARFATIGASAATPASEGDAGSSRAYVPSASASLQRKGLDLPEHKLWGLLADIRREPALYTKAWDVSGGTYPRAQRSLGTLAMSRYAFAEAYEHFALALEVNPSNPEIWFAAGACALELRRWDDAVRCFSATVNGKPDYSEAWNNLAAAHLHKGNMRAAFSALEHTVRLYRKSWKVWENYLNCAMTLGKHQQAANALSVLADLRGTTDSKTLIPIQFSAAQSQLHMMCLAELTRAAVEEARGSFKASAAAHAAALATGDAAAAAAAAEASVLERSFLSYKMLQVLGKYAAIAASVSSQESAMGGRKRGGGEAAGAGNSLTAQLQLRERVKQEKAVRAAKAAAVKAAAKAGVGADGAASGPEDEDEAPSANDDADGEQEEDCEDEEGDVVGELPALTASAAAAAAAAVLPASTAAASSSAALFDSLGQQYQVLVSDCLGRVNAAVQQYGPAAAACEARLALLMKASGWANRPEVVEEIVAALEDAVRYYGLAVDVEKHLEAAAAAGAAGAVKGEAVATATAARLLVSRTQAALSLAAKSAANPAALAAAASTAETLLKRVQGWMPAPAAAPAPVADAYDAYGGGGYDDWR